MPARNICAPVSTRGVCVGGGGGAETLENHVATSGWYSTEVIALVMSTSLRRSGSMEYVMSFEPLHLKPERLHCAVGAVVNVGGNHWVALRSVKGQVLQIDSQGGDPRPLTSVEYRVDL